MLKLRSNTKHSFASHLATESIRWLHKEPSVETDSDRSEREKDDKVFRTYRIPPDVGMTRREGFGNSYVGFLKLIFIGED